MERKKYPLNLYKWAKTPEEYLNQRIDTSGDCWIWLKGKDKDGYGQCHCSRVAKDLGVTRSHQLAYVAWRGPIPEDLFVCHTCDNPSCVNPDHLFLGTAFDNNKDMVEKGRQRYPGSPKKVDPYIILSLKGKKPATSVAEQFGISWSRVYQIWRGEFGNEASKCKK